MTKVTNDYEAIFIIDQDKTEEETGEITEKFKNLIASSGEVQSVDVWGRRHLAYPINDKKEGFYVLINFAAQPDFPKELDRVFGITDGIIRSIIVRKDERKNRGE
ncbi:MAG: 30S ribosomal protein S6 [Clostridiaceae bacterium]|nr:30S ribosomal protein S6 [Clostridiaceae bacterium]